MPTRVGSYGSQHGSQRDAVGRQSVRRLPFRIAGLARSNAEDSSPVAQTIRDLAVLVERYPVLSGARWAQLREPFEIVREDGRAEPRVILLGQPEKFSVIESGGLPDRVDVEEVADFAARERGRGLAPDRVTDDSTGPTSSRTGGSWRQSTPRSTSIVSPPGDSTSSRANSVPIARR